MSGPENDRSSVEYEVAGNQSDYANTPQDLLSRTTHGETIRGTTMEETPTVLLADDDRALVDGRAAQLSDDYDVQTAYGGTAALEAFENEDIDIAVLDRNMPDRNGGDVLEVARERGHDCPVVMLTGIEPDGDIVEMPFDEYIVKPAGGETLRTTLEELLSSDDAGLDDDVLDALGDTKSRHCWQLLTEGEYSASELAEETGYSLPTVYRRLNALTQAEIVESRTVLAPGGGHHDRFTAVVEGIEVAVDRGIQVEIKRREERVA